MKDRKYDFVVVPSHHYTSVKFFKAIKYFYLFFVYFKIHFKGFYFPVLKIVLCTRFKWISKAKVEYFYNFSSQFRSVSFETLKTFTK